MPLFCGVIGCSNRKNREKTLSYFRLPKVITHQGSQTQGLSEKRRRLWLSNINRADLKGTKLKNLRVCDKHFVHGKKVDLYDVNHVDWAPTVKLGYNKIKKPDEKRLLRAKGREAKRRKRDVPSALLSQNENPSHGKRLKPVKVLNTSSTEERELNADSSVDEPVQPDLKALCSAQQKEIQVLRSELHAVKDGVLSLKLTEDALRGKDEKVKSLTGLPNFAILMVVFEFTAPFINHSCRNSLSKFQEFLIVLMRLRLNLPYQFLGYHFGIDMSTVSRIFEKWIRIMDIRLSLLIVWPERDALRKTMPNDFRRNFGNKVSVIIDCFEVFTDTPSSYSARAITWSNYKHHNTVKFLIGITPQGSISFISKAWGGRTSDKHITDHCGILNHLLPGDIVIANQGFNIADGVGLFCAQLAIPAFTHEKSQLSALEVEETRKIANVRIHVERVIGLVRRKFPILQGTLPAELLMCKDGDADTTIDKIVRVCCALTNLCPSVVPFD